MARVGEAAGVGTGRQSPRPGIQALMPPCATHHQDRGPSAALPSRGPFFFRGLGMEGETK